MRTQARLLEDVRLNSFHGLFDEYTLPFTSLEQEEEFAYSVGKDPRYGEGEEELRLLDEEVTYDLGNGTHETFKVDMERLEG